MRRLAVALCAAGTAAFPCGAADLAPRLAALRPNVVLVLTDDQGYGDFSINGNPVLRTPNLDRVAREGVRFRNFHVSPTCAPTRSALLSGRHEFRSGVTHTIFERERMISRQLRGRAGKHVLRPGDPARRDVREDQRLLPAGRARCDREPRTP